MSDALAGSPIVVGVDGSHAAIQAAQWAAAEAAHRSAPLLLVHVVTVPASSYTGGLGLTTGYYEGLEEQGRKFLTETKAQLADAFPGLDVRTALDTGDPVGTLVEHSRGARLLVLGSRGLGGVTGILAGSTAVGMVAYGHCPVAVVRGRTEHQQPPASGPVVVGVDGTRASDTAVELAFEEASIRGAQLVAVHTWVEFSSDSAYAYARQFVRDWSEVEEHEKELLATGLAGWQQKYPDVPVRRVVVRDRPVRQLLAHAADAQLMVVGSRGHGGFAGMLLGSTSQALIYHAPCPLLVVRGR
ncbi:MAG TPA: universal stress protein [Pseudonocardiaceae bacterium]|nr:universal stress protein [Pseudonocardiaceae bacterium]